MYDTLSVKLVKPTKALNALEECFEIFMNKINGNYFRNEETSEDEITKISSVGWQNDLRSGLGCGSV